LDKFPLGRIFITRHALDTLEELSVYLGLLRHKRGDWGDVCEEDAHSNDEALRDGGRLLSVYSDGYDTTFWIITEHDRSSTTILLPEDY